MTAHIENVAIDTLYKDEENPRKADGARLSLLRLSLAKLGFILPVCATPNGMLLSGHQRLTVSHQLGYQNIPVQYANVEEKDIRGINVLFNRATNDFSAFDTGGSSRERLELDDIIEQAEELPDFEGEEWFALGAEVRGIRGLGKSIAEKYDKKAAVIATNLLRKGIQVPIVVTPKGRVVNGAHRLFSAREAGKSKWPIVEIPEDHAELALNFLNYLSMDYQVDGDFKRVLRYSAYRRPQNNRGSVPKAYRFWANGERTLLDKDSYSRDYWINFREIHGQHLIDFGSGLSKVAPFLQKKGYDCIDFEPYRIDPSKKKGEPDPDFSRARNSEFLDRVADGTKFDSIFLASVLNSVPFPKDRMIVLAVVHALCSTDTVVYGTCRDISDFEYEYGGIRNANYFVFDSEPGVRLGDSLAKPKIQKFHSQEEAAGMFKHLWKTYDFWAGGNVFYFRLKNPKRANTSVLKEAIKVEFDLPYADGSSMGLVEKANWAFGKRFGVSL